MSRFAVVYEDPDYEYNPEDIEDNVEPEDENAEEPEYYGA
jgi:hypothetical protein